MLQTLRDPNETEKISVHTDYSILQNFDRGVVTSTLDVIQFITKTQDILRDIIRENLDTFGRLWTIFCLKISCLSHEIVFYQFTIPLHISLHIILPSFYYS